MASRILFIGPFRHPAPLPSEALSSVAALASTFNLRGNFLFCCGTKWNGSPDIMSYEAINYSAPR